MNSRVDPKLSFDAAGPESVIALDNIKTVCGKPQLSGAVESLIIIAASTTLSAVRCLDPVSLSAGRSQRPEGVAGRRSSRR
jgi:hypothetical protein